MDIENKFYVYTYTDPRDGQIFYVGKGCGKRLYDHLKEKKEKTDNIFKWRKINSIREDGHEPIIEKIQENLLEETAYEVEEAIIKQYGRIGIDEGGILTNRCPDLRPPSAKGKKFSLEHNEKISIAYKERIADPNYVHPLKGIPRPKEVMEKTQKAYAEWKNTPEGKLTIQKNMAATKTPEAIENLKSSLKNYWNSPVGLLRASLTTFPVMNKEPGYVHPLKGKPVPQHVKDAASKANKGKVLSEDHKRKISESKKTQYADNPSSHPALGRKHSEETKEKISQSIKEIPRTQTQIENLDRLHNSAIGTKRSEDIKAKIAKSVSAKWEMTDKDGNIFIVENLSAWCKEHKFTQSNFSNVIKGLSTHAYGYRCRKLVN